MGKRRHADKSTIYSPEYKAYHEAKQRCRNPSNRGFKNYGGRGIEFRFNSFAEFFRVLGKRPTPKHSLDRIDNNGHYEPGNVRWATRIQQVLNRRYTHWVKTSEGGKPITQHSKDLGLARSTLNVRLSHGWCLPCATTLGKRQRCVHRGENQNAQTCRATYKS